MPSKLDLIQQLRLRDLFGGQPQFGGQVMQEPLFPAPTITTSPLDPPQSKRNSPFMDQYREALMNEPRREDYKSGKVGKALAIIAGGLTGATEGIGRGIEVGSGILDRPYQQAQETYGNKIGRFRELADIEHRTGAEERKYELDTNKQMIDLIKTNSDLKLNDARAKELVSRAELAGKEFKVNELTGMLEVIDKRNGTVQTIKQFAETPEGKTKREFGLFKDKHKIEQSGRERIEGIQQSNRVAMEGIRFGNDKQLARLKKELETRDVSATQDNAAWEGAYKEILTEYPDMRGQLFEIDQNDPQKSLKLKENYNPDVYEFFVKAVREKKAIKLGGKSSGYSGPSIPTGLQVTVPLGNEPTVTDPLRAAAIQFLKDNGHDENDEENIAHAMEDLKKAAGDGIPQIRNVLPQSRTR